MSRINQLKKSHWPLLLFSLRFENSSWIGQVDGFAEFSSRLRTDFPNIGYLIHGLSKGVAMGSTTPWMSLDVETKAAAELERALGNPQSVVNAVGLSIHESGAISAACDAFVAPIGSGMALYKWLTNKPGVAFSNTFCLDPANPGRWAFAVFDEFRENIVPTTYLPLEAVADLESSRHGEPSRANFTLNVDVLFLAIRNLLLTIFDSPDQ